MAFRTFFFDETNYTSQNFAEYLGAQYNNGVFSDTAFELSSSVDPFSLTIQPGKAVINGRMLVSDAAYTISIDPAESGKARFDIIALRLNVANKTVLPVVLKGREVSASGVSSSNLPYSPALTSTNSTADGICDLALFKVYVTSSGTVITATSDEDGYDSDLRTIAVHPLTQALIDKYESRFASESAARQGSFDHLNSSKASVIDLSALDVRVTSIETNGAIIKKITESNGKYNTNEELLLVIASYDNKTSSFIACRFDNEYSSALAVVDYQISGNQYIGVTFPHSRNYATLSKSNSSIVIMGVYEIKAVIA